VVKEHCCCFCNNYRWSKVTKEESCCIYISAYCFFCLVFSAFCCCFFFKLIFDIQQPSTTDDNIVVIQRFLKSFFTIPLKFILSFFLSSAGHWLTRCFYSQHVIWEFSRCVRNIIIITIFQENGGFVLFLYHFLLLSTFNWKNLMTRWTKFNLHHFNHWKSELSWEKMH